MRSLGFQGAWTVKGGSASASLRISGFISGSIAELERGWMRRDVQLGCRVVDWLCG
jgi:hypothetical protein